MSRKERGEFIMEKFLYTVPEVAKILRCNTNRVYDLNKAGLLPFLKLGQLKCREFRVQGRRALADLGGIEVSQLVN